ncbi:hypothetical protein PsorP6_015247 [Peronosclerospora sorghi]|uniref:Uncharacterized protein n=1 Tax=Peronosclerospora sorghi TaxID=230839 RepID=A0ACC0VSR2_9STRA|nr:hypothetical protein PsorP6_015247 [Peronosclerospora sorghi]
MSVHGGSDDRSEDEGKSLTWHLGKATEHKKSGNGTHATPPRTTTVGYCVLMKHVSMVGKDEQTHSTAPWVPIFLFLFWKSRCNDEIQIIENTICFEKATRILELTKHFMVFRRNAAYTYYPS